MVFIRRFEEVSQALFLRGQIRGSIHLCMGQEAVSAGVVAALSDEDMVAATYRGHGHALALGVDPTAFLAEMLGRPDGICGGRAGSMNIASPKDRLVGCFGIVGSSIAAATGAAMTLKRRGRGGVAVAFFGDGALNQGYFHECLNFAAVQQLPLVLVCENNGYGEFTPMREVTAGDVVDRAAAFGVRAGRVDGQDASAVHEAATAAIGPARHGQPAFLEALTYRFNDHARGDPIDYRPVGEMQAWRERDPLKIGRSSLIDRYGLTEQEVDDLDRQEAARVQQCREDALATATHDPAEWTAREFAP